MDAVAFRLLDTAVGVGVFVAFGAHFHFVSYTTPLCIATKYKSYSSLPLLTFLLTIFSVDVPYTVLAFSGYRYCVCFTLESSRGSRLYPCTE